MKQHTIVIILSLIGISLNYIGIAQSFQFAGEDPFNIIIMETNPEENTVKLIFSDRDKDGDKDLYLFGFSIDENMLFDFDHIVYFIHYQENIGTKYSPQFGPRIKILEDFLFPRGPFLPCMGDINGDGEDDILAHAEIEFLTEILNMVIYEKQSMKSESEYARMEASQYGLSSIIPRSFVWPLLADIDSDGDLDVLASGNITTDFSFNELKSVCLYSKNIGSKQNPNYIGWFENPFNLKSQDLEEIMAAGDIDNDGDVDILSVVSDNEFTPLHFKENTFSENGVTNFADPVVSPFGLPVSTEDISFGEPILIDIDGDMDLDLFILFISEDNQSTVLRYYKNDLCTSVESQVTHIICEGTIITIGNQDFDMEGQYVINTIDETGCDSIINLDLIVNSNFETMISEDLCEGDFYVIGTQQFNQSGTYQLTLMSSEGCDSLVSAELAFHTINADVSLVDNTLTALSTVMLYQWIDCNSNLEIPDATEQNFTAVESGDYAVILMNEYGCEVTSECITVMVSSISETNVFSKIKLVPNPTSDRLFIQNDESLHIDVIRIIDQFGKQLMQIENIHDHEFNLKNMAPGIHFVEIISGDNKFVKKLIKI